MKRALASILTLALLIALIPTAAFAADDFVLEIKGGETVDSMETVDGVACLRVDLYLNGIADDRLLTAASFALTYDSAQLTYVTDSQTRGVSNLYTVDGNGKQIGEASLIMNAGIAGKVLFAFASDYGCRIQTGAPLISLYFRINGNLTSGTEVAFGFADGAHAESVEMASTLPGSTAVTTRRTLSASFAPYTVSGTVATVEWNTEDVGFKGTTPYVIANGEAQTPRFVVKDEKGSVIDAANYSYEYKENTNAGTGYVIVTFKGDYSGTARGWFKIYLPATENTYVENRTDGIYVKWDPVDGAAGYVIYRRAWSSTTNGWTSFERWNNTTGTSYLDGADANHKVYAGTRYQYGVKAYFAKRTDPVSGATIGGNVGDNYNLGEVGPLKTTVRITTRKLVQVRPGNKEMTVKWEASKNFTGYQIQYSTDASFKENAEAIKIDTPSTYWTTVKELTSGATYYVRIRSYHEFEGMTYFGGWSNVLDVTVK